VRTIGTAHVSEHVPKQIPIGQIFRFEKYAPSLQLSIAFNFTLPRVKTRGYNIGRGYASFQFKKLAVKMCLTFLVFAKL